MNLSWIKISNVKQKCYLLLTRALLVSSSIHEAWQIHGRSKMFGHFTVWLELGVDPSVCILVYRYVTLNKVKDWWSEPCQGGTWGAEEETLFLPPGSLLALTTFQNEVHLFACTGSAGPVTCIAVLHLFLLLLTNSGMGSCPKVPKISCVDVD